MKAVSRTVNAVTRRTYLLLLGVLVVGGATYLWSGRAHVDYRATALVSLSYSAATDQPVVLQDVAGAISYAQKYGSAPLPSAVTREVAAAVPQRSATQIASEVRLSPVSGQPLITVTVHDGDPLVARSIATQTALAVVHYYTATIAQHAADVISGLQQQIALQKAAIAQTKAQITAAHNAGASTASLQQTLSQEQTQLQQLQDQLSAAQSDALDPQPKLVVASIATSADQVSMSAGLNVAFGALAGLLAAGGLALLLDYLDGTLRTPSDIKQWSGLDTLATVPDAPVDEASLVLLPETYFTGAAQFRTLLRNLRFLDATQMQQVVLVAPVDERPTEDWVGVNLGVTAALAGQRALVLDANWSQPSLATRFGLDVSETGFFTSVASMKADTEQVRSAIYETAIPNLHAMPVGPLPPNLDDLLKTDLLDRLFDTLRETFAIIVVLAPRELLSVAGMRMLEQTDGVLLSARAGLTSSEEAGALATSLRKANAYLVGAVLIGAPAAPGAGSATPRRARALTGSPSPTSAMAGDPNTSNLPAESVSDAPLSNETPPASSVAATVERPDGGGAEA